MKRVKTADLIGPDFEYPDWSHYTINQVLEKVKP